MGGAYVSRGGDERASSERVSEWKAVDTDECLILLIPLKRIRRKFWLGVFRQPSNLLG